MILSRGRSFTGNVPSENRVDAGVLSQSWRELPAILRIADGGMMRKFSWMLLVSLVFSVYAEDKDLLVVESAKELKRITDKKII